MPVRVDIPARIRVDVPALSERRDELEDALAAATGRALRTSAVEVLEPRGGYLGVRLAEPRFTWSGDGLANAHPALRADVEAGLRAAIAGAVRATGLVGAGGDAPAPLAAPPVALLDENRLDRPFGLYELPAYERGGKTANVPVKQPVEELVSGSGGTFFDWWKVSEEDAVLVYDLTLRNFGLDVPEKGFQGPIFLDPRQGFIVAVFEYPDGELVFAARIDVRDIGFDARGNMVDQRGALPPMAAYSIDWFAAPGGELEAKLTEHYRPLVEVELAKVRRKITSDSEFKRGVDNAVAAKVKADLADMAGVTSVVRLRVGPKPYLIRSRSSLTPPPEMQNARLIPLVHPIEPPRAGEGGTGGGAAGKGIGTGASKDVTTTSAKGRGEKGGVEGAAPVAEPVAFVDIEGGSATGSLFPPPSPEMDRVELVCEAYLGEPSITALGAEGQAMKRVIDKIAWLLQIQPCEFAGNFLLNAATALGGRATQVALWEVTDKGEMEAAPAGTGNVGNVRFIPVAGPQIQFLRHLATTVPLMTQLERMIGEVYRARSDLIEGVWKGQPLSWINRWRYDFVVGGMERNVGLIFVMTCNVIFQQLLNTSRENILKRRNEGFYEHFRQVVLPQLEDIDDLLRARDLLKDADTVAYLVRYGQASQRRKYHDVEVVGAPPAAAAPPPGPPPQDWAEATEAVLNVLGPLGAAQPAAAATKYQLIAEEDGGYRIRDKHGRVWDLEALEMTITMRRGTVEEMEPLAKQFTDLPEVVERFRDVRTSLWDDAEENRQAVDAETKKLLDEMLDSNAEQIEKAKDDLWTGFRASTIVENLREATVARTNYALQGIHKEAHDQIGEFFRGDPFYGLGIESVFAAELGKRELASALEMSFIVLLSVVCPPVGAGMGLGSAIHHYGKASERRDLYKSLIDPEKVLSAAEVEAGLFAAKLGIVMALIPGAIHGSGVHFARRGATEVTEAGVKGAAAKGASRLAQHLDRVLKAGIVETFALELTTNWLVDKVVGASIQVLMDHLQKEWGATGPIGGLQPAIARLIRQLEAKRATEVNLPPVAGGGI